MKLLATVDRRAYFDLAVYNQAYGDIPLQIASSWRDVSYQTHKHLEEAVFLYNVLLYQGGNGKSKKTIVLLHTPFDLVS